ncbi:Spindle pole body component like [Actinidia chinensis var. chinensis]|uniref:Spindle pole body component like n=1 Tax=Actinidia chinensis var. chinensis TaxID=1590841 RepID=A0A2R6PQP4_ACTCC|nr:Spindle pole body component like [Actinidia chinensis var. chinensis]
MQQQLDNLCEQVNFFKDQPGTWDDTTFAKNNDFLFNEQFASEKAISVAHGCWLSDQHQPNDPTSISMVKASSGEETLKYKIPLSNVAEPEERRMSDLSDWASSVTSSVDIQLNTLAIEQDIYNLKKECEEKDATTKELSTFLQSSEVAGSKRIAELEDIIRRKNMRITKLKKDMLVLEQKVVHYTRLRRPSSASSSNMRSYQ